MLAVLIDRTSCKAQVFFALNTRIILDMSKIENYTYTTDI